MAKKSLAVLERELKYARDRAAYLARTDRPTKTTVDRRPSVLVGYRSSLIEIGAGTALVKVQASQPSLTFFGGETALGLVVSSGTNLDLAIPAIRGLKPAKINAIVGDATPTSRIAEGSKRRYIKYSANNTGGAQSSYSAPVCKNDAANTPDEQQTQAETVAAAIDGSLGGEYGRVYFTPEKFTSSLK